MEAVPAASSLRAEPLRVLESVPESVPGYVPEYVPQHADSLIFTRLRRHYVDLVMRDKKQQQLNTYPADEDVVEVLHRALSTGQLISSSSVSSPERDLGETIEKLINLDRPKFIFDVTTSPLAISFAQLASETFPWLLAVMVPVAKKKTPTSGESLGLNATAASSNLYVAKTRTDASVPLPAGVFDCLQVIEGGLEALVFSQLPSEFEESMGRALCRCNTTILPKDLPRTPYFAFWESMTALLLASVVSTDDLCSIRFDIPTEFSRIRYSHTLVRRNDNSTTLSTPSGHISAAHLAALDLSLPSVHHLCASVNDLCNAGPASSSGRSSGMPSVLSGFVMSGSTLSDAASSGGGSASTMRRLRLIHTVLGGDDEGGSKSQRAPVARPTYTPYTPSNRSAAARAPSSPSSMQRRRLLSYSGIIRQSAESLQASVQSTWELLEQPSSSLGEYDTFKAPPNDTSASLPAAVASLSREARLRQRSMQEREEATYRRWARFLQEEDALSSLANAAGAPSVFILGRHIAMLGSKVAQSLRTLGAGRGMLVALHTDELSVQPHRELMDLMGVQNTMLCRARLTGALLAAMLGAPEQAEVSIVQADVTLRLLSLALAGALGGIDGVDGVDGDGKCGVEAFGEMMAAVLSLAKTTFLELPSRHALDVVVALVAPQCASEYERFFPATMDPADTPPPLGAAFLQLVCAYLPPDVVVDISERKFSPVADAHVGGGGAIFRVELSSGGRKVMGRGVSVYSLLHLGVHPSQKKQLLLLYMDLPLWALGPGEAVRVAPWTVFARPSELAAWSLWHHAPTLDGRGSAAAAADSLARTGSLGARVGVSQGRGGYASERARAKVLFSVLSRELTRFPAEVAEGKFSWVEHGSGYGFFSALLASKYPNATIVTLETDGGKASQHVAMADQLEIKNIAVCHVTADTATVLKNIVESPEFFRFQLLSHNIMDSFAATPLGDWGLQIGTLLSASLTTFLLVPPASQVSLAFEVFFGELPVRSLARVLDPAPGPGLGDAALERPESTIASHPRPAFKGIESLLLLGHARAKSGDTHVSLSHVLLGSNSGSLHTPFVRADIYNMTRHVMHHYDYAKDGHTRTYTMKVSVNKTLSTDVTHALGDPSLASSTQLSEGIRLDGFSRSFLLPLGSHSNNHQVVDVHLVRDKDQFPIPYVKIQGVTLITALRLGLEATQRDRLFETFLRLPLFEDMAPWNIVLAGSDLEYIDYDTRDRVFDFDVPHAYQVMAVLLNYKRTVEDFKKCGKKASTVYGLPYVSDCVGGTAGASKSCPDLRRPVPCGDGECHTDYISCLRSLSSMAERLGTSTDKAHSLEVLMKESIRLGSSGGFDEKGSVV